MSDDRQETQLEPLLTLQPLGTPGHGLRVIGELDLSSAGQLQEALAALDGDGEVTLDLSELTFIDSSGLSAIVAYSRSLDGSKLVLANPSRATQRILEITGLDGHSHLVIRRDSDGK